jgi:hypothetical protein
MALGCERAKMRVVREIKQRSIVFGGEDHSGWLPAGASAPLPTPCRTVLVDFLIVQEEQSSFLLEWIGPDRETSGDTWHPDLDAALSQAQHSFGIEHGEWCEPR